MNLTEKIDNNIENLIWKGNKVLTAEGKYKQSEKKLVSMSASELRQCYEHCKTMLFNKDIQNPGRYLVLDIISDQSNRCGAELFVRYIEQNKQLSRFSLTSSINDFIRNNKEAFKGFIPVLGDMFDKLPNEFSKVPLNLVIDACLDRLGIVNKKHITRTFILKQGIWLTPSESKELSEYTLTGDIKEKIKVIEERLTLKEFEKLIINSKGLNYTQMRAMLNIKPNKKYIDLTTVQLETLRNRILFSLEESVKNHINSWETRMSEIEKVAEYNGYIL